MTVENLYKLFLKYPSVTTDSRNCPHDSIFFALKGDRFDGNDYIRQTLDSGAAFAVSDRHDLPDDERIIKVDDVLITLQQLAAYHRTEMKTPVIAITGTNGKTTTKELIAASLSSQYKTLYTQGNLNNHIGVPLTLLKITAEHDFAVVEMGANHQGEIAALCQIARPDFGVITNIGKAHLEGFGSFENIIDTKTELYKYIGNHGKSVFANDDNAVLAPYLSSLNVTRYGKSGSCFVCGSAISSTPFLNIEWKQQNNSATYEIHTNLVGDYNFENVLTAICVSSFFGVSPQNICQAISKYIPQNNRSQNRQTERNNLIIDAYNANPASMKVAVDNFLALPVSPKMLILGEMRELGKYSREEHQILVNRIRESAVNQVFLCGSNFINLDNIPSSWKIFNSTDELLKTLETETIKEYNILIKGSRGNQLEKAVDKL
jgi:UDP-N-acetylmuramoyl-tripeptide--D-alanyl-D-alanine ligase